MKLNTIAVSILIGFISLSFVLIYAINTWDDNNKRTTEISRISHQKDYCRALGEKQISNDNKSEHGFNISISMNRYTYHQESDKCIYEFVLTHNRGLEYTNTYYISDLETKTTIAFLNDPISSSVKEARSTFKNDCVSYISYQSKFFTDSEVSPDCNY